MKKINLELENCYGIKKLKIELDFSKYQAISIYAANGVMKSSLAQTFLDLSNNNPSQDRIFPKRKTVRNITCTVSENLDGKSIFVVTPYNEKLSHSEKTSTLLVNNTLRKEYEQLHLDVDKTKDIFLKAVKEQAKSKRNFETEISLAFTPKDNELHKALSRIKTELLNQKTTPFVDIPYDIIFDEKVVSFLSTKDFKTAIKDYVEKYNTLLEGSTYFKKGIFDYYNAGTIAKSLADNGFFSAKHTISLNALAKKEITTQEELELLVDSEKSSILSDDVLKKKFAEIEKQITKNISVRDFSDYLSSHPTILPHLENLQAFKEEIIKSYIVANITLFKDFIETYEAMEKRKTEIEEQAKLERTQWESVIDIFNNRFHVPFKLQAQNRVAVILGAEPLLNLGFIYCDGDEVAQIGKDELLRSLSTGERKALYVLNIIFEVEARKKSGQKTLFIIDDIADSFDYKNKYAIIEYLKEIYESDQFFQLILTHNFDFFRTISSRFVPYSNCFMSFKTNTGLKLEPARGIKNIFVNDWKPNFFKDTKKRIASIPFIRNLIEYTKGSDDPNYLKLTSLLHLKIDSDAITQADLAAIYNSLFGESVQINDPDKKVFDILNEEVQSCLTAHEGLNFENKIVLSIAIRLEAEKFMLKKINDTNQTNAIIENQTKELFDLYKKKFAAELDNQIIIGRVLLITPETIHLNSFMYEPILDMSDEHLRSLYRDVQKLNQ